MAIERNPCEDEVVVPQPRPGLGLGNRGLGRGTGVRTGLGGVGQPDEVDDPPDQDAMPFPSPFREIDTEQDQEKQKEKEQLFEQAANKRFFTTATREITVIPNSLFLSKDVDLQRVFSTLVRSNSKRQVNHGAVWFKDREQEDLENADLFRWSLHGFWASTGDREGFVNKASAGHENVFAVDEQQDERFQRAYMMPDTTVLKLYTGKPEYRKYSLSVPQAKTPEDIKILGARGIVKEEIRFSLFNDLTKKFVGRRGASPGQFLEAYAPSAFKKSNMRTQRKMDKFLSMYLFGNQDPSNWSSLADLEGWSGAAANFYRNGIIKTQTKSSIESNGFMYKDFVFDAPVAFFEEELNGMLMAPFHSAKITKTVGNVDFVNLKGYDNELEVPNIYYYYNSMELKKDFEEGTINNQSTLAQDVSFLQGINDILNKYKTNRKEEIFTTRDVLKFPSDRVENFDDINEFMRAYAENYVEIKINTTQGGFINSLLQRNKMDRILMESISPPKNNQGSTTIKNLATKFETKVSMVLDDSFKGDNKEQNSVEKTLNDRTSSSIPITVMDGFYNLIKDYIPGASNNDLQNVDRFEYPLLYRGWNNIALMRLEEVIRSQIFAKELEEFIANTKLQRSYADLLSGERAYSEVVGFKVEKYEVSEDNEETLIQTFILMDSNAIDTINFIDSQVMPYKKYRYKILSINFVLGTEYAYSPFIKIDSPFVDLKVSSRLGVYIIEAPFYDQVVEIRDMPPVFPQVSFLPYQGVDDKLSILLNTNYGETKEKWLMDPNANKEVLKTKYGMDREGFITFKTDSLPSAFEIRLEEPPSSYPDFKDKSRPDYYHKIIPAISNAGICIEDIIPNKHYYYIFRTLDNYDMERKPGWHKKFMASNPTEVYKIRMVSYANGIFLEMETFEMAQKSKDLKITFERLLKISPNFQQSSLNFSKVFKKLKDKVKIPNNSVDKVRKEQGLVTHEQYIASSFEFQQTAPDPKELALGDVEKESDSIWSKKFKIRIKSKDSGKSIDFNVKFIQDEVDLVKEE